MLYTPDKHPSHIRSSSQRCVVIWNYAPFACAKTWLLLKEATKHKSFKTFATSWKTSYQRHLTSAFPRCRATSRELQAPQPLAPAEVSEHAFRAIAMHAYAEKPPFVHFFSNKFNIMSALFVHQPSTLPQKIDSREGLFWCKRGLVCECGKMNINSKRPPLAPLLGLFGAKYSAICC